MKKLLNKAVQSHKEHISFHTPAHGGGMRFSDALFTNGQDYVGNPLDITELSYSGNLFSTQGVIADSAANTSKTYLAEHTLFVTAGATVGVHTAINALRDKCFLVVGAAHVSVFAALRLARAKAYYTEQTDNIDKAIQKTHAEVLIVTSPDYFGKTLPLECVAAVAKQQNITLIVDASHGSHFVFSTKLPDSATLYGDIVIHSLHKTLPVLTGGALIHFRSELKDRVLAAFSDTHTTSPSYPVMLSIENAVCEFEKKGKEFYARVLQEVESFAKKLPPPFVLEAANDPTRLVISSPYSGESVGAHLERDNIFVETCTENKVILIATPYNCHYLKAVADSLSTASSLKHYAGEESFARQKGIICLKAFDNVEYVNINCAEGRELFKETGLYPPGIPLFFAGEVLTKEKIAFILRNANRMFGLDKDRVAVVK